MAPHINNKKTARHANATLARIPALIPKDFLEVLEALGTLQVLPSPHSMELLARFQ